MKVKLILSSALISLIINSLSYDNAKASDYSDVQLLEGMVTEATRHVAHLKILPFYDEVNISYDPNDIVPFKTSEVAFDYPYGQCTWYVYHRMKQFGEGVDYLMGDAKDWIDQARHQDYTIYHEPLLHAAVVFDSNLLGASAEYGHVAFVEHVFSDDSILISESNVEGLGIISKRIIPREAAQTLRYFKV
ncbi:CHAP domain-containing protein [Staphylococcus massiliensis]|uniref:CHAP domain-containing protein n=1 Tax=Staphylococcus massiliensis TaxID=555791 RepID=UPI00370D3E4A